MKLFNYSKYNKPYNFSYEILRHSLGFFIIILIIYCLKIPAAYHNFYAEDGMIFYQQAKDLPFPFDFLTPSGGYLMLISRIIARIVIIFPIEITPLINFILLLYFVL